jgi:putative ABC transport system substrate-binding protein
MAQQAAGVQRRIGVLVAGSRSSAGLLFEAFRSGMKDLGWVEGSDLLIEVRFGDGDAKRLDPLAAELVAMKLDLIFAPTTLGSLAVRRASPSIPIVFATSIDPLGSGLISGWARPGRNATGLSTIGAELGAKRIQLLRDCSPSLSRVVVLNEPSPGFSPDVLDTVMGAGTRLGIRMSVQNASNEAEIDAAFGRFVHDRPDGIFVLEGAAFLRFRKLIVAHVATARIPTVYPDSQYVDDGGLMSYGANYADQFRRAAGYVDKILKGAQASDLPVEQPTKFDLVINLKVARDQGIRVPQSLLTLANRLIE